MKVVCIHIENYGARMNWSCNQDVGLYVSQIRILLKRWTKCKVINNYWMQFSKISNYSRYHTKIVFNNSHDYYQKNDLLIKMIHLYL